MNSAVPIEQRTYFKKHVGNYSTIGILTWFCIVIALIGSVLSALGICTGSACSDAHSYRLFGLPFATIGIPMFMMLVAARLFSHWLMFTTELGDSIIFGSAGAEIWFLYVQKYQIGHWCPICVVIACAVFILVLVRISEITFSRKESYMKWYRKALREILPLTVFLIGLSIAMVGVQKADAETGLTGVWLGNKKTDVEIYYVSDWYCSYCRKAEPTIEQMLPDVSKIARYTFIDYPVHKESFEFVPYNLSLLMNEQKRYIEARHALLEVAAKTRNPNEAQIRAALSKRGINLKMADFGTVMRTSNEVVNFLKSSGVNLTPSVVIRNVKTGEKRILAGTDQIQKPIILATVKSLGG